METASTPSPTISMQLNSWYEKLPGHALLKMELSGLSDVLPKLFGYNLLQLGYELNEQDLQECQIHKKFFLAREAPGTAQDNFIQGNPNNLPIQPESLDAVIIFHALEFIDNPEKTLQEAYNALIPGGAAIIFCFNPHSLMGLTCLMQNTAAVPWKGNFISPWRLGKMLRQASFAFSDYKTFYFRPFLKNEKLLKKLRFLESIGQMFWPYFGASSMFFCKKEVASMILDIPKAKNHNLVHSVPSTAHLCSSDTPH